MPNVEHTLKNIFSEKFAGLPSLLRIKGNQESNQEFPPPTHPHPADHQKSLHRVGIYGDLHIYY